MLTLLLTPEKTAVSGLNTEGQVALPRVSIEEFPIAVGMVKKIENPTTQQLWEPQDLTGWTMQAAIGMPFLPPTGGTYTLTTADGTTDPIEVTGGLTALQAGIDAAVLAITATEISEGYYLLTWINNGAETLASAAPEGLIHSSNAEVKMLQEGSASTPAVQTIRLLQAPAALASLSTYEDEVTGTLTEVQTGGGGNNHQVRITFDPVPFGGSFYLKSISFTESMPWNVEADVLKEAIEAMTYAISTEVGVGNVHVVKEGDGRYFIEFVGDRADEDIGTITLTTTGMRRTPVWTGDIDTNTEAMEALLGTVTEVTLWLEITGAPSGGAERKLYREPITLVAPILRPTV